MRTLIRSALAAIALALAVPIGTPAHAQPVCRAGAVTQYDMAGRYVSLTEPLEVELYPCGGAYVGWEAYGLPHGVSYYAAFPVRGGGYALVGMTPDANTGSWLGGTDRLVVKPAEPGFIQAIVWDKNLGPVGVYRLYKVR